MTYAIVQPTVNTNASYKDTGRLSFYRYEDLQVLAELFAQTNAILACDAKNDARGGMTQDAVYTVVWPYLGMWFGGQQASPSMLAPQKKFLDWQRIDQMANGTWDLPYAASFNDSWTYLDQDPFSGHSPYMHQDDRLSAAGTTAGTYALFGQADVDMKNQNFPAAVGLNIPFSPVQWTDPRDVVKLYSDAKNLSWHEFDVLTWNPNMTRNQALGQAFDQTFVYTDIRRMRQRRVKDASGSEEQTSRMVDSGWGNTPFSHREFWEKDAYTDGSHPDQYVYEWESEVDSLEFDGTHPNFERNVPVPSSTFAVECLYDRRVMFVWEARVEEHVYYKNGGSSTSTQTRWYSFITDLSRAGTQNFVDYLGNDRGLCMKYTCPTTIIAQQHSSIKGILGWSIPNFSQSWTPETPNYVTSQSRELNIYMRGCYSLQTSYLTETLTRP